MRKDAQRRYDAIRKQYTVIWPRSTTEQAVKDWLSSIGSDLIPNSGDGGAIPTLVAEVRWTDKGLRHVLRMTPQDQSHVLSMLEGHLSGVTVDPIDTEAEKLDINPVFAIDVVMSDPSRNLRIDSIRALAVGILHSVPTIAEGEVVTYQVIASHTENIKVPGGQVMKSKTTWTDMLLGRIEAPQEEIVDRKQKVSEQNFNVTLRIAAQAANEIRGRELVGGVLRSLRAAESNYVKLTGRILKYDVTDTINLALTPRKKTAQLTISEMAALIAAPIGEPAVPGLPQGAARRIAPTESVHRGEVIDGMPTGRLLGRSNIPGRERPVALDYAYVDKNMIYIGGIGSGKSVGMANNALDDMNRGMGVFVIDASGSDSGQSLYSRVKDYVPDHRVNDVIDIHVRNNSDYPVAFDLFKQGLGTGAIDQIVNVFSKIYPDIENGVSVRELLYHGLWTLIEADLNFVDLSPLLRPKNAAETRWALGVAEKVKDQELKDFWARMKSMGFGTSPTDRKHDAWDRYTDPLYRRLWQLIGRPEIRHMIGQTTEHGEGLNWESAIREHKIVLISLSGLPADSAQILANLLTKMLWESAQRFEIEQPGKKPHAEPLAVPNALYLDEFQVSISIKDALVDMLARSRKHGLPVTLGTQFIGAVNRDLQNTVMNNVFNRVIYPLKSQDEASIWSRNITTDKLTPWDFQHGNPYEPIVQLETDGGAQVLTIHALDERKKTGNSQRVSALSRQNYGKHIDTVRKEIKDRQRYSTGESKAGEAEPDKKTDKQTLDLSDEDWM